MKIPEFKRSPQIFPEFERTWETALADLDSDGDLDLVITSLGPGTSVWLNDGHGFFKESGQKFPSGIHGIAVGDLDRDGDQDLFFAPLGRNLASPIYLNDGRGVFVQSHSALPLEPTEKVQLMDVDNDGDLDAYLWWKGGLYWNDGKGHFQKSRLAWPENPSFSDLNGDGCIDYINPQWGKGFEIVLNDKKANFAVSGFLPKNDLTFSYMEFADVDNDGDTDVIYSNGLDNEKHPSGVLLNDGTGRLTDSGQKLSAVAFGFIGTGDLNNDGWVDVIITDRENPAKIWMNNGEGIFIDSGVALGEGGLWNNCVIKDIDGDGDMDVLITKVYGGSHGLWFNQLMEKKSR